MSNSADDRRFLVIIPCLNEARHIGGLLDQLGKLRGAAIRIVVADGGSTDGTQALVAQHARADGRMELLHNDRRLQAAAVNLAVRQFGDAFDYFIRLDAHGEYPDDYCDTLLAEALATGADSVVVSMRTEGSTAVQTATAAAQNSVLGNGGAKHRLCTKGQWVDHGHHALMRIEAFRSVGGYDESFTCNEDAELDIRFYRAGYRVWLTEKTRMTYFPRNSYRGLFLQYLRYGNGRARNLFKHRIVPKVRQMLPLAIAPACAGLAIAALLPIAALPVVLWGMICLTFGACLAFRERNPVLLLSGISTMVMHFAWSLGFWLQVVSRVASWNRERPA